MNYNSVCFFVSPYPKDSGYSPCFGLVPLGVHFTSYEGH